MEKDATNSLDRQKIKGRTPQRSSEQLVQVIRKEKKRQSEFLGHYMRRQELGSTVMAGKSLGKKGKPREKYSSGLTRRHVKIKAFEIIRNTNDCTRQRSLILHRCPARLYI